MAETSPNLQYIQEKLGDKILEMQISHGDEIVFLDRRGMRESFRFLKEDPQLQLDFLSDITAVDYWQKKALRFEVVYHVLSLKERRKLRVRIPVPESEPIVDSLVPLWRGANFMEREVWDLFGIRFTDHPNLRRVLLYEEFQGHPLRKDYPVNLWQPRVPERKVDGTFVDERSRNRQLQLKQAWGKKPQS
jgi:NADH-quinone oxidoreductase subunit C